MSVFSKVDPGVRYRRNPFPLKDSLQIDCNMGEIVPVFARQMIPTDAFRMSNRSLVRFMPMFAPEFTEINMYVHYFFVPYRLLSKYFPEKYGSEEELMAIITGGEGAFDPETMTNDVSDGEFPTSDYALGISKGTIGDALGFPTGVALSDVPDYWQDFIMIVYNEFYRNEVIQEKVTDLTLNSNLLIRNWAKDYFTASLPTQQKGVAPALPLTGTTSAEWDSDVEATIYGGSHTHTTKVYPETSGSGTADIYYDISNHRIGTNRSSGTGANDYITSNASTPEMSATIADDALNDNVVDFAEIFKFFTKIAVSNHPVVADTVFHNIAVDI